MGEGWDATHYPNGRLRGGRRPLAGTGACCLCLFEGANDSPESTASRSKQCPRNLPAKPVRHLGLLLAVVVHTADLQDRDGARRVLARLGHRFPRLRVIWADGGYQGPKLGTWLAQQAPDWVLEIVPRPTTAPGFQVLPRRWVVERTFAWLGRYRRLSKDYEGLPETSETWIRLAMIDRMLHRLGPA